MIFKIRNFYKFIVNGKDCIVSATSVIDAMNIIESEGYKEYSFIRKV